MNFKKLPLALAMSLVLTGATGASWAIEAGGFDLTGSGFASVVAGRMLGGTRGGEASDFKRPIFVSDYAQGGIYDGRSGVQFKPDSKLGLQGSASLPNKQFSVTGQIVARGARDGEVNLEWLYASYRLNENFTIQAGRKRIPMFYYSDTQDIGFALPWTHLPSGPYGWEAVNYNGVSLAYQGSWGAWGAAVNLVAGNESLKDSGYWKVYNGKESRTDVRWDNIVGGDISLSRDWFETRFVYLQSKMRQKTASNIWDPATDTYVPLSEPSTFDDPAATQKIYGLAFHVDYDNLLVKAESIYIDHNSVIGYTDNAYLLAFGYRFGKWTPMITFSDYHSRAIAADGTDPTALEATRMTSLTLRYDLSTSSDLKVQLDIQKDLSGPNYTLDGGTVMTNRYGNSRLLTVSYDVVF